MALGEEYKEPETEVKDLVLEKLGKSIDALVKAQEISRTLAKSLNLPSSSDLTKAMSAIPKGQENNGEFDYTHVLNPEHKAAGYSLKVQPVGEYEGKTHLEAHLFHGSNPDPIGT
jgi:hypothetical protein